MGINTAVKTVLALMALLSAVTFVLFGVDKHKSVNGKRRIAERTLFLTSLLGGALGGLIGMYMFRHKTKHITFVIGIPLLLILNIAVAFLIVKLIR